MALRALLPVLALLALDPPQAWAGTGAETDARDGALVWLVQAEAGAPAEITAEMRALADALQIAPVLEIMREEGVAYGATLEEEMFPGRGRAEWRAVVGMIYDTARLTAEFEAAFAREMAPFAADTEAAVAFFTSDLGARIVDLEIEARRALLEPEVEDAARLMAEDMLAGGEPRMDALQRFAETNDLIESNVSGALNANLAFYRGLAEGGAMEEDVPEDQMLADVWGQEPDVRADTEEWLYSYLALAYQPLSDDELAAYQTFSESPAGQRVNAALFAAFDKVFTRISADLGRAAARQMQGEDI